MTESTQASAAPVLSQTEVRKWSDGIRQKLHGSKWQFLWLVFRRYLWLDLVVPAAAVLVVFLCWGYFLRFEKIQPNDAEILYRSVFQGFSAFVALIFAFVAFTYRRGEEWTADLGDKAEKEMKEFFIDIDVADQAEVRIWYRLYENRILNTFLCPEKRRLRFEKAKRTFGKYMFEKYLVNSLPIRTVLLLLPFVGLILVCLSLLAGILSGESWPAAVFFGTFFSVVWFFWYAWRVLSSIAQDTRGKYDKEMEIRAAESKVLLDGFGIVLDQISQDEVKRFVRLDSP